jgi:parallel beta-helix repeat protein
VSFLGAFDEQTQGFRLEAYVESFSIGGIAITGAGPDGQYQDGATSGPTDPDADNGAYFRAVLTLAQRELYFDGMIRLPVNSLSGAPALIVMRGKFTASGVTLDGTLDNWEPVPAVVFDGSVHAEVAFQTVALELAFTLDTSILGDASVHFDGSLSASPQGFDLHLTSEIQMAGLMNLEATIDVGSNSPFAIALAGDLELPGTTPGRARIEGAIGSQGASAFGRIDNWMLLPGLSFDGQVSLSGRADGSQLVVALDADADLLGSRLHVDGTVVAGASGPPDVLLNATIVLTVPRVRLVEVELDGTIDTRQGLLVRLGGSMDVFGSKVLDLDATLRANGDDWLLRFDASTGFHFTVPVVDDDVGSVELEFQFAVGLEFGSNVTGGGNFVFEVDLDGKAKATVANQPLFDSSIGVDVRVDLAAALDAGTALPAMLTGGARGVFAADGVDSDRLVVSYSDVYGNYFQGIYLGGSNDDAVLSDNRIHNQAGTGIYIGGQRATISGNTVYAQDTGININNVPATVTGNDIYGNTYGISGSGPSVANPMVVRGNAIGIQSGIGGYYNAAPDSFTYSVRDGHAESAPATVSIVVYRTVFTGTDGDDGFAFTAGDTWHELVVTLSGGSPETYRYSAPESLNLSINGAGGRDTITISGGPGDEMAYVGQTGKGTVKVVGTNYTVNGSNLEAIDVQAGGDTARLYDSAGDDNFTAYPMYVLLANDPSNPTAYSNKATGFRYAHASASGGGMDKAWLYDSLGNDDFAGYPTYAYLSNTTPGQAFYNRANYFDRVVATSSGGADIARFFDSALKDVFTFRAASDDAVMTGNGYLNQALNFRCVLAYATTGGDEASLHDSASDDKFYGSGSIARLYDAALAAYLVDVRSLQKLDVFGGTGTNTRTIVRPIDYALAFSGTWLGDPWP